MLYNKFKGKRRQHSLNSRPTNQHRSGLHPKNIPLRVWWDLRGMVYYELLDENQTITADVYCQQLRRLKPNSAGNLPLLVNRKGVTLEEDNGKPHTARVTNNTLEEFNW